MNYPINYKAQKKIIYSITGVWEGRLDIYYPKETTQLKPLVLNVYAGGWIHRYWEQQTSFGSFFTNRNSVTNIEYRKVNQENATAAIEGVRCALLYVVHNAKRFQIDTNWIVVMGSSAGWHLALVASLQ